MHDLILVTLPNILTESSRCNKAIILDPDNSLWGNNLIIFQRINYDINSNNLSLIKMYQLIFYLAGVFLTSSMSFRPKINAPVGRLAIVADGNSPDPDDLAGTAVSLALLRGANLSERLVHYSHSCDLVRGTRISEDAERERHFLMQASCDVTARRWGGYEKLTFFDASWQQKETIEHLSQAIEESSEENPLWIVEAGEPDIIGFALEAVPKEKCKYVKIITHHKANDDAGDYYSWQKILDFGIEEIRIPDQNIKLKVDLRKWNWAKNHTDSRLQQMWLFGKMAETDNVVQFQKGKWDCSDAGMVLYWITGAINGGLEQGTVKDIKSLLLDYIARNPSE